MNVDESATVLAEIQEALELFPPEQMVRLPSKFFIQMTEELVKLWTKKNK